MNKIMGFREGVIWVMLACCFFSKADAQERINKTNLKFDKTIGVLNTAKGWSFNSGTGDWVDYTNLIHNDPSYKQFKGETFDYFKAHHEQNFINLEFKTLKFLDSTYYVFLITKMDGYYEYPAIREDWKPYKKIQAFILNSKEFDQLVNLEDELTLLIKREVSERMDYDYKEENLLDRVQYNLESEKLYSPEQTFPVKVSDEGMVRFYLPERFSIYKKYYFDKAYFEISMEDYMKLLGV